ncbi:hypothetical protein C0993_008946 [Termitomyces sp. T159_Od127]|nr:hypothetical protein C0993_008946 [Termitomyces sp. T159_Od127]
MATYTHTYQPTDYQTNAYGRPVPENYYAMSTPQPMYLAPLIEHYPTLVPRYWAPDQNQVPYGPSISQGIPQDWRCNSLQATTGTHQWVLPRGMPETLPGTWAPLALAHASAAFFTLRQYYTQPIPALPPPSQGYPDTYYLPWPQPSAVPPSHTPPSLLGRQQVKAYIQQRDKVLQSLCISPAEFARCACALLVDLNLWDKLRTLVDEIHTSSTPQHFEDPVDPTCSFHVQCKELIKPQDPASALVPCQQEELNAASNILKALNFTRGLFNQPATRTIGLSACPHANTLPSAFRTWGQPADTDSCPDAPPHPPPADNNNTSTHTLSYIDELEAPGSGLAPPGGAPAPEFQHDRPPHFDLRHPHGNTPPPHNNPPSIH